MDVARVGHKDKIRRRRMWMLAGGIALAVIVIYGLMSLDRAAFPVSSSEILTSTVERGPMVRAVRGAGTLVPQEIRVVVATSEGRVERREVEPGAQVEPETILVVLSNPELIQELGDSRLDLRAGEAELEDLESQLESQVLTQQAEAARIASEYEEARIQVTANEELAVDGLIPDIELQRSKLRATQLEQRAAIERLRLEKAKEGAQARLRSKAANVDQQRAVVTLREGQVAALEVRAGLSGVLQQLDVEGGQRVDAGAEIARVARPDRLKAELRITETQAKDLVIGLATSIDTRNGLIDGKVSRIDPAVTEGYVTVDVRLEGELPPGARPDLSIDGTIELESLEDVLMVSRPSNVQANSNASLFVVDGDGDSATKRSVRIGRRSIDAVEILDGLSIGDLVITSDSSRYADNDTIRIVQ